MSSPTPSQPPMAPPTTREEILHRIHESFANVNMDTFAESLSLPPIILLHCLERVKDVSHPSVDPITGQPNGGFNCPLSIHELAAELNTPSELIHRAMRAIINHLNVRGCSNEGLCMGTDRTGWVDVSGATAAATSSKLTSPSAAYAPRKPSSRTSEGVRSTSKSPSKSPHSPPLRPQSPNPPRPPPMAQSHAQPHPRAPPGRPNTLLVRRPTRQRPARHQAVRHVRLARRRQGSGYEGERDVDGVD
ncbi:hypothetical protein P154DRAFT_109749 [Amniculicola lignicola CBS 123094]|uniref:Uncharacterized protein n=1 Tax=Amniculicola lignicola CBS 123094 TaxID=1392246 RepID=A0A6A5WQ57_9PLEO|nr:hypothetical protein P154DRAFT_109749 [Amniculicola lignicola CBS 123094]